MKRKTSSTSKPKPISAAKPPAEAAAAKPAAAEAASSNVTGKTTKRTKAPAKPAQKAPAKPKRMSGLDAAAKVLASAKEPLGCGEIFERIQAQKLWKTGGKTPSATLNAAMIREIKGKGKESRFKKVGRGKFAVTR
jgi:hypothetical protein